MARLPITRKDSVVDQLDQVNQSIAQRAYRRFLERGDRSGSALDDWFSAERELLWRPAVEVREEDGAFTVSAVIEAVDLKDLSVDMTPQDVVIKGTTELKKSDNAGSDRYREFVSGSIFQSVRFTKAVDVEKAKAEFRDGVLTVTAPLAVEVQDKPSPSKAA
jgi:HSP20 family protein